MPYTYNFSEVSGGYSKYKVDAEPWRIIHPETQLNQLKATDGTVTKIVFGLPNAEKVIDTRFDTVIINGTAYSPPSNADTIFDLLNAVFFNVNSGSGGSGVVPSGTAYKEISSTYTTTDADYTINAISGTFNLTVVSAANRVGKAQEIINTGSGTITVLITGQPSIILQPGHGVVIRSTGSNYIIISMY